jgi:hypothetical protein
MIQDAIDSYKLILRFTSVKKVDLDLINEVLGLLGYTINDSIKEHLVDIVNGLSEEKGYSNLLEVAKDPEFLSTVAALQKDASSLGLNVTKIIEHKVPTQTAGTLNEDMIEVDSVIKCPHCALPFSILDAPGVRNRK